MYELVSARLYYGHKHAIGSVVLCNGHCVFHGTFKEAKEFLRKRNKA